MTDDVTRGLSLLADEAAAAPIDADAVIATARTRTRNRAILATAFVTVVVLSALVVSLGVVRPDSPEIAEKPTRHGPPTLSTEVRNLPNRALLVADFSNQLGAAWKRILPAGWTPRPFQVSCNDFSCSGEGEIRDEAGSVHMTINLSQSYDMGSCYRPKCTKTLLADGTLVAFQKGEGNTNGQQEKTATLNAVRPDSTTLALSIRWPADRPTPPLPDDQWKRFGTAFTVR